MDDMTSHVLRRDGEIDKGRPRDSFEQRRPERYQKAYESTTYESKSEDTMISLTTTLLVVALLCVLVPHVAAFGAGDIPE